MNLDDYSFVTERKTGGSTVTYYRNNKNPNDEIRVETIDGEDVITPVNIKEDLCR